MAILKDCDACQRTKLSQSFGACTKCSCDCHKKGETMTTPTDTPTEVIKTSDAPIKLPVKYDEKGWCVRETDFGKVLFFMPRSFGDNEPTIAAETHRQGRHIATCINEYPRLVAENAALREACKKALTCASINSDVRNLIQSVLGRGE